MFSQGLSSNDTENAQHDTTHTTHATKIHTMHCMRCWAVRILEALEEEDVKADPPGTYSHVKPSDARHHMISRRYRMGLRGVPRRTRSDNDSRVYIMFLATNAEAQKFKEDEKFTPEPSTPPPGHRFACQKPTCSTMFSVSFPVHVKPI